MRRTALVAGILSCAIFSITTVGHAKAETLDHLTADESPRINNELTLLGLAPRAAEEATSQDAEQETDSKEVETPPAPENERHIVVKNENLTDIAKKFDTTWQRIFSKNTQISHPDSITVGDELVIPLEDEALEERAIPEPVVVAAVAQPVAATSTSTRSTSTATVQSAPAPSSNSAGNTYYKGYCTWYVKNRRPDLPNSLGNAITWASRASALGYATGSTPRVGAVGQQGNHVVYVESVNGDGTVTVSEMNFKGWNITSSRTVAASSFTYIY